MALHARGNGLAWRNPYGGLLGKSSRKFGHNIAVTAAADIIAQGGDAILPSAAADLSIVSDDANDAAAGTGAQEVTILYHDDSWNAQMAVIPTDGTTPVSAGVNAFRASRAWVSGAGSGDAAAGAITIKIGASTINLIEQESAADPRGQTLYCCDTVPAKTLDGRTVTKAAILGWSASMLPHATAVIRLSILMRPLGGVWQVMDLYKITGSTQPAPPPKEWLVPEFATPATDIKVRCTSVSTGTQEIESAFYYDLIT